MNVVETGRLVLRKLEPRDAPFILGLLNEEGFLRFIGDKGVRTVGDAREYILKGPMESYRRFGFGLYLTSLRESGVPVGICGLVKRDTLPQPDVGFAFSTPHWARGYASEAAAAVLDYARDAVGLTRILAITALENHGSMAVLVKIGLRFERRVRLIDNGPEVNLFSAHLTQMV